MFTLARKIKNLLLFSLGYAVYLVTGKNTRFGYFSLINLFCLTSGRFNGFMTNLLKFFYPIQKIQTANGVLGNLSKENINTIVDSLNRDGYFVFTSALPEEKCKALLEASLSIPAKSRILDQSTSKILPTKQLFDRQNPSAIRYDYDFADLLVIPEVQELMADQSLIAIAEKYLGVKPIIDIIAMWWLTAFGNGPDKNAAQFYHYDMDRIKWLKVFLYITDVGPQNGPHCFIRQSHQNDAIPKSILEKGYARIDDEEVFKAFDRSMEKEFTGPRGTIILEDTRGLHKGLHVQADDRLVFQIQYTVSMFGTPDNKYPKINHQQISDASLKQAYKENQRLYSQFIN